MTDLKKLQKEIYQNKKNKDIKYVLFNKLLISIRSNHNGK